MLRLGELVEKGPRKAESDRWQGRFAGSAPGDKIQRVVAGRFSGVEIREVLRYSVESAETAWNGPLKTQEYSADHRAPLPCEACCRCRGSQPCSVHPSFLIVNLYSHHASSAHFGPDRSGCVISATFLQKFARFLGNIGSIGVSYPGPPHAPRLVIRGMSPEPRYAVPPHHDNPSMLWIEDLLFVVTPG